MSWQKEERDHNEELKDLLESFSDKFLDGDDFLVKKLMNKTSQAQEEEDLDGTSEASIALSECSNELKKEGSTAGEKIKDFLEALSKWADKIPASFLESIVDFFKGITNQVESSFTMGK